MPLVRLMPLVALVAIGTNCRVADIRNDQLKAGITLAMEQKGRAILTGLHKTYRAHLWRTKKLMTVTYADEWPGFFTRTMAMPWHKNKQAVKFEMVLNTDDGRLEFLENPKQGEVWGIQNWATYKITAGNPPKFAKDKDIWFWLPTYSYFTQCAYRIGEATIVAHAGEDSMNGEQYDKVFATWDSAEPSAKIDQYIIWINKKTGYIDLVEYTIRDMQKFMTGKLYYADYKLVDGIPVAHRQSAGDVYGGDVVHQAEFKSVEFSDTFESSRMYPDPNQKWSKHN